MSTNKLKSTSTKLNYSQINSEKVLVDFLVVAGGGGAGQAPGSSGTYASGGGGAGGLRTSYGPSGGGNGPEPKLNLTKGTTYTIAVGAGGAAGATPGATNGGNSSISGIDITTISCLGGGAGFYSIQQNNAGLDGVGDGGCGGGNSPFMYQNSRFKGFGTPNQGYDGARGNLASSISGSGGGAGGPGDFNAPGGIGVSSSITGTATYYAGGGASGSNINHSGGLGGGGSRNTSGTSNTGGGGGGNQGSGVASSSSGAGGSGVVIIRAPQAAVATTGSPAVSNDGSYTIYRFTGDGSVTF